MAVVGLKDVVSYGYVEGVAGVGRRVARKGKTISPDKYLIIVWPMMAGQTGPKARRTNTRESTGQETRLDQIIRDEKDRLRMRKKNQSRLSDTKKAAIDANAISILKKSVIPEAAIIQLQVAQSPQ